VDKGDRLIALQYYERVGVPIPRVGILFEMGTKVVDYVVGTELRHAGFEVGEHDDKKLLKRSYEAEAEYFCR
jgi:hypothetical protein